MKTFGLGIHELVLRWRSSLIMALILALPVLFYLLLGSYQKGLENRYLNLADDFLLVQESGSMGEFYGSRLPASLERDLRELGFSQVYAQIHTITGTSPENAVLLRGVQLENYQNTELYKIIDGRPLQLGDSPRRAMIGVQLARQCSAFTGQNIRLRGRDFQVIGIFENGTYADYEAWISLEDAQALLGWGTDVSVFIIPSGGPLQVGDELKAGVAVVQKGESGQNLVSEWAPFFGLIHNVIFSMGVAVMVALIHSVWRIAWQRKRDLAILFSLGFNRLSLFWYLCAQGVGMTAVGACIGIAGAMLIAAGFQLRTAGISIQAVFDYALIFRGVAASIFAALAAAAVASLAVLQQNVIELMKVEE